MLLKSMKRFQVINKPVNSFRYNLLCRIRSWHLSFMKKLTVTYIYITFFSIIFSCTDASRVQDRDENLCYLYSHRWPSSILYYLTIINQTTSTITSDNKDIGSDNSIEIGLIYELSKDSIGLPQLKLTYDRIKLTLKSANGDKQEYDAGNTSSSHEVEQLLALLKGSSLIIHFDSTGKQKSVTGIEETYQKVLSAVSTREPALRKAMQERLEGIIGANFIKNSLEPAGQLFPDSAVKVGDSWTKQMDQEAGIKISSQSHFTVTSLKNNTAVVEIESTIDNKKSIPLNIAGYQVNTSLTGSQTGQFKTDMLTGMLLEASTKTTLDGEVQMLGRSIPLTMVIKKEVSLKKAP